MARELVRKFQTRLLANEIEQAIQTTRQISTASRERKWSEAIELGEEAVIQLSRLSGEARLSTDERTAVSSSRDSMALLARYFERNRQKPSDLAISPQKSKDIHTILIVLAEIQTRLQSETLEV